LNSKLKEIRYIKFGLKHTIFVNFQNDVYGCGDNSKGALCIKFCDENIIKGSVIVLTHLKWEFETVIKKVKCGWNNTFVLTGKLFLNFQKMVNYIPQVMENLGNLDTLTHLILQISLVELHSEMIA